MDTILETPPKTTTPSQEKTETECSTVTPTRPVIETDHTASYKGFHKTLTPDHLRVPKAFKYPERYTSPTDLMVSPVTKVVLARRKAGALLPHGRSQPKIPDLDVQDLGIFQC